MGAWAPLSWNSLTSAEVVGSEELHALIAGQQMRARTGWCLGRTPGDGDGAEALHEEAPGVAGYQDAPLDLAQQALGGLSWVRLGKDHLLHSVLGARGLGHEAAVQALHLGFTHHAPAVDEGEQQRVVCGQRTTSCTWTSPEGSAWSAPGPEEMRRGSLQIPHPHLAGEKQEVQEGNQARAGVAASPPEVREGTSLLIRPPATLTSQGASCQTFPSLRRGADTQMPPEVSVLIAQGLTVYKKVPETGSLLDRQELMSQSGFPGNRVHRGYF